MQCTTYLNLGSMMSVLGTIPADSGEIENPHELNNGDTESTDEANEGIGDVRAALTIDVDADDDDDDVDVDLGW